MYNQFMMHGQKNIKLQYLPRAAMYRKRWVDGYCVGIVAEDGTFRMPHLIFSGRSTRFFPTLHDRFLSLRPAQLVPKLGGVRAYSKKQILEYCYLF